MVQTKRYLLAAQASFFAGVIICCIIHPPVAKAMTDGLSYYGTQLPTVLPFAFACVATGAFLWLASRSYADVILARLLRIIAAGLLGILLTPYSLNAAFDWVHTGFGTIIFICELLVVWRLWAAGSFDVWMWLLFGAQAAGDLISLFSLSNFIGIMFTGQVLVQVAFTSLLVRASFSYSSTLVHSIHS